MRFVLYLFSLSATLYLVSGECYSNTWSSRIKCTDNGRTSNPFGTKLSCSCKESCFPITLRCGIRSKWVSDITSSPCTHESKSFIELGDNLPGLLASYTGHKVQFKCKDGFELKGMHVALCEKGDMHMEDFPACVQKGRDIEGSGLGSGDAPRTDDDDSGDDYNGSGDDDIRDRFRNAILSNRGRFQ